MSYSYDIMASTRIKIPFRLQAVPVYNSGPQIITNEFAYPIKSYKVEGDYPFFHP